MPKNGGLTLAKWLLAGCLLCWSACFSGQAAPAVRYSVNVWSTEEGLPQSSVISMIRTRDGYLWLGTLNGLVRFDGAHFTIFDESNTPGLKSSRIVYLFEDSQRNLWIGTETAGVLLVKDGVVLDMHLGGGSRDGRLVAACEDAQGTVWLTTADGHLGRYRANELHIPVAGSSLSNVRTLIAEKNGILWDGTDRNIGAIDPINETNLDVMPRENSTKVGKLDFLLASKSGGHWRWVDGTIQKWSSNHLDRTLCAYPWATGVEISTACEDRDGNLVVGTRGQGLYWFDADGHATNLSTADGISNNYIISLHADDAGNLWVGTDGGGLNRVKRQVFHPIEESQGLAIRSICEDNEGGLWSSSDGKGVTRLKGGVLSTNDSVWGSLQKRNVRALFVDREQSVWASTIGWGVFQCQNGVFQTRGAGIVNPEATCIHQDRAGAIWVGTQGGLACFDHNTWKMLTTANGLSANIVRAIVDDAEGNLWIGTEGGGLNRLHNGKFDSFSEKDGFPSDNISALLIDKEGVLWVGTFGSGLVRVRDGKWTHYTTKNGLVSNGINYLIEDDLGCLWIGSNRGVMRLRKKALNDFATGKAEFVPCTVYGRRDGLPATECTPGAQPAACKSHDGKLWFPTISGMSWSDPAHFQFNTNPPQVTIESFMIEGQQQITSGLRAKLPESLTIPAGAERVEIQYASINLADPTGIRFKYWLEGHEKSWSSAETSRIVRYSKLPPGQYTFHVTACNEEGVWNSAGATMAITVLPPFWQTWWFLSLSGAGLLGAIVGGVYFVSTQKLQRQVEGFRHQQVLEKERARIARDIHDQVGASLTQVALLGEMVECDKDLPEEIEIHARQICQTARDTSRALDEIVWTVNPSNDTLDGLINYICKNAQDYLTVAGLRYRLEIPSQLPATAITPEARHNVFLAAKESVTNVVKHAKATEVWIRLHLQERQFILEIEDNGRGPAGLNDKAKQSRNGLRNMRKRMEDIGGEFSIGPGAQGGTLVRLTVPTQKP